MKDELRVWQSTTCSQGQSWGSTLYATFASFICQALWTGASDATRHI